jgi:hypothetical protein
MQVQCMMMQEGSKHAKQSRNGLFMKEQENFGWTSNLHYLYYAF